MLPQNNPDRIRIAFDDHRLVASWPAPAGHPLADGRCSRLRTDLPAQLPVGLARPGDAPFTIDLDSTICETSRHPIDGLVATAEHA